MQKTTSTRGDPTGPAATAMSDLREPHHHWPWTTAPSGLRSPPRAHLGASRNLSPVPKNVHDLARLASTSGAFQLALPPTGLRTYRRRLLRRASRTSLQRAIPC